MTISAPTIILVRHADATEADGDWIGFWPSMTDDEARAYAAAKFGVSETQVELRRTGGAVLVRVKPAAEGD